MLIYHIVSLVALAFAAIAGFRRGLARRIPAFIGLAFGIICARIFTDPLARSLYDLMPSMRGMVSEQYFFTTLAATLILLAVYLLFRVITGFLGTVLGALPHGILDNLGGSIFALFRMLVFLSMGFNLLLSVQDNCGLLRSLKSDDGNIVEGVMLVGPALCGSESPEEYAHEVQIQEAHKISI